MRVFKKIMFIVLALVPILPLLLFAVCNVGNTNGVNIMPLGRFTMYQTDNAYNLYADGPVDPFEQRFYTYIIVEKNTIFDHVLSGVIPLRDNMQVSDYHSFGDITNDVYLPYGDYVIYSSYTVTIDGVIVGSDPFINRVASIYSWFSGVGLTPSPYVIFVFAYLAYMLFVYVLFMIFDIIVFIPKKISEMLGG